MTKSKGMLQRAATNVLLRIEDIVCASKADIDHLLMQAAELEKLLTVHRAIELAAGSTSVATPFDTAVFLAVYNRHTHAVGAGEISGPPREPLTQALLV